MTKSFVAGSALLAALSTSAAAMDTAPVFQTLPPSASSAPYDWSGFYGGPGTDSPWSRVPYDALIAAAPVGSSAPGSALGGLQLGYNYQSGPFVVGLESDFAWRHGMDSVLLAPIGLESLNVRGEQGWLGTLRPRAGVAADNWLFYATGGIAYGSFRNDAAEPLAGAIRPPADSGTRAGWTAGGGIQYAGGKHWSLGLEYLYADFGKANLSQPALGPFSATTFRDQSHLLRGK